MYQFYFFRIVLMVSVATINVQGLRDQKKRKGIFQSLQTQSFDVVALQETHADASVVSQWKREWPGLSCWSVAGPTSAGVALLFSSKLNVSLLNDVSDKQGRVLRAIVNIDDCKLQFLNVYGPNPVRLNESNHFFQNLDSYVDPQLPLILLGDFK